MNIVLCTDKNYIPYCTITICSICENNTNSNLSFFIICNGLTKIDKEKLLLFLNNYHNISINFIDVTNDISTFFPIGNKDQNSYISIASYYRLLLTKLLPDTIDKLIYLDCDIIVRSSLTELWNIDISDYAIGGVLDTLSYDVNTYNRLRYSPSLQYINAGVLLINLDFWRKNNVITNFFELAKRYPERLKYHDQDILNIAFQSNKKIIPFTFNYHDGLFRKELKMLYIYWDEILNNEKSPCIVHYSAHIKPWHKNCIHPFVKEFDYYKQKTPYKNLKKTAIKHSISYNLKKIIRNTFSLIGLCKKTKPEIEYRLI